MILQKTHLLEWRTEIMGKKLAKRAFSPQLNNLDFES